MFLKVEWNETDYYIILYYKLTSYFFSYFSLQAARVSKENAVYSMEFILQRAGQAGLFGTWLYV